MSLLDRLIWGFRYEDLEIFPRTSSPSSPSSPPSSEVFRRAAVFRAQMRERSVIPLLILPEVHDALDGCLSCGVPIPEGFRCRLCQLAVHLALGLIPPEVTDG